MWRIALVLAVAIGLTGCGAAPSNEKGGTNNARTETAATTTTGNSNTEAASATSGVAKPTTKGMAWMLGSNLSLAALMHDRGATEQSDSLLGKARILANELKVEVPPLPVKTGESAKDGAATLGYMLNEAGRAIGQKLKEQYDQSHADLFELALKSNILLMMYSPGESTGKTIAGVIERNGPRANLPEGLWKPVVDKIEAGASFEDVKEAVFKMHTDVRRHLEASA